LLVADLATKWLAVVIAGDGDLGFITPRRNPELALGVLTLDMHPAAIVALVIVTIGVVVHGLRLTHQGLSPAWPPLLMISGILGNGIDRAATGAVHDWLYLGQVVANVADFVLVAGIAGYVFYAWRAAGVE